MKMTVLLAEDDPITRRGLTEVLRKEGLIAIPAADGRQAWDLFQQHAPDFVCLDVMMPGLSGYDVCRKIRLAGSQVPVIFITAKGEEVDKVVGLELGADDYIVKPFGVKEMVARIRAVARRCLKEQSAESENSLPQVEFAMDDLVVFPTELRARRGEQVYDLSLREVRILSLLFRSAGQVVDRRTLMNYAWNQEYFPNSRTLDQHVSQLRKRIEVDSKNPRLIQTVHGVGYRFQPGLDEG
ncbi:MAG: response regulator transcription factor [Planctomycetales bacterium]|nr:response regulator transcription factor [Planctomycetales bacterium]